MKRSVKLTALVIMGLLSACSPEVEEKETHSQTENQDVNVPDEHGLAVAKAGQVGVQIHELNPTKEKISENGRAVAMKSSEPQLNEEELISNATGYQSPASQIEHPTQRYLAELVNPEPTRRTIRASSGGSITAKEGTILKVPANTFVDRDGNPVKGSVTLVVDEFLDLGQALANGLTTFSGGRRLETGGMMQIQALDESGNQLKLAEGKEITLKIPTQDLKNGMQMFTGKRANGSLDWIPQGNGVQNQFGFRRQDMQRVYNGEYVRRAQFPGGPLALSTYLEKFLEYPSDAARRGITGSCTMKFSVDINGKVRKYPKVVYTDHPTFAHKARRLLMRTRFYPAFSVDGEFVPDRDLNIRFFFQPESVTDRDYKWEDFKEEYEAFKNEGIISEAYVNEILEEIEGKMDSLVKVRFGEGRQVRYSYSSQNLMYNVVQTSELGWINCDKFVETALPLANVVLDLDGAGSQVIFLVLKEERSIMAATYTCQAGKICFPNLPVGYNYKVVGVDRREGKPFIGSLEGKVSREPTTMQLSFKETTVDKLKASLEEIGSFSGG